MLDWNTIKVHNRLHTNRQLQLTVPEAWISPCHQPVSVFFLTKIIWPFWRLSCSLLEAVYGAITVASSGFFPLLPSDWKIGKKNLLVFFSFKINLKIKNKNGTECNVDSSIYHFIFQLQVVATLFSKFWSFKFRCVMLALWSWNTFRLLTRILKKYWLKLAQIVNIEC